jgi:hypothetical protein
MSQKTYLHTIQQKPEYQLFLRERSDKAAQGLLTLLVTINAGAFVTIVELLEQDHWLLTLFSIGTISALFARTGLYYIYRYEVTMFEHPDNKEELEKLERLRKDWWSYTERAAWTSLASFILGVIILTTLFIINN